MPGLRLDAIVHRVDALTHVKLDLDLSVRWASKKDMPIAGNTYWDLRHMGATGQRTERVLGGLRMPDIVVQSANVTSTGQGESPVSPQGGGW